MGEVQTISWDGVFSKGGRGAHAGYCSCSAQDLCLIVLSEALEVFAIRQMEV
jgi:hypothetical protein